MRDTDTIEMEREVLCVCAQWARDGRPPHTKHHRHCANYFDELEEESVAVIKDLLDAIRGGNVQTSDAYKRALFFATGRMSEPAPGKTLCELFALEEDLNASKTAQEAKPL